MSSKKKEEERETYSLKKISLKWKSITTPRTINDQVFMVKKKLKDREMAQWLKSFTYLKEVHGSIPSSHIGPTSKGSDGLLTSHDTKHAQAT